MKSILAVLLMVLSKTVFAQLKVIAIDKNAIPASIKYAGHVVNAARYTDSEGEHVIVTTETGKIKLSSDEDFVRAEVFGYCYLIKDDKSVLVWQMHDFTEDCILDVKGAFVPKTFAVTDLNKNGQAEVWLMYSIACRGDVSPAVMKIIMHEGNKKYAIRGESFVRLSAKEQYGGKYTLDEVFKKAPLVFRNFAADLWKKNMKETWGK